jgi:hypothetical protein
MRHLLRLNPNTNEIQVVPGAVPANDTEIAMTTRSILDLMEAMAAQVEVPTEDLAKSRAFPGFELTGMFRAWSVRFASTVENRGRLTRLYQ